MGKPQLMQDVGEVDKLTTTSKEVVGAINEVKKGALPLTGGNMTGDIFIQNEGYPSVWVQKGTTNGIGKLEGSNNCVSLQAYNVKGDNTNRRILRLDNSASVTDITSSLRLVDYTNGNSRYYRLYGEHNVPRALDHSLYSLGFNGSEFSETDLSGNIALILSKMKQGESLIGWVARDNAFVNLAKSVNSYLGVDTDYNLNILCYYGDTSPNIINFMQNDNLNIYQFSYDNVLRYRGNISQLANYTNLKMLGLTDTCTPTELAKAMPNYSTLNMVAYQTNHPNLELPQGYGVLEVKRFTANYCSFTFRTSVWDKSQPTLYTAHYHTDNDLWTGWKLSSTLTTTIDFPYTVGYQHENLTNNSYQQSSIVKTNTECEVIVNAKKTDGSAFVVNDIIGTLPTGYKPKNNIRIMASGYPYGNNANILIETGTGRISVKSVSSTSMTVCSFVARFECD